jgi:hypothetical protein
VFDVASDPLEAVPTRGMRSKLHTKNAAAIPATTHKCNCTRPPDFMANGFMFRESSTSMLMNEILRILAQVRFQGYPVF